MDNFPVAGVAASLGDLEAVALLLGCVPPGTGMAFVVLGCPTGAPDDAMLERLSELTSLPVARGCDGQAVRPNHVYLVPPNVELAMAQGALCSPPVSSGGDGLSPVDSFLKSLAHDLGKLAVGVLMAGAGLNGAAGLSAIRSGGGLAMLEGPRPIEVGDTDRPWGVGETTHVLAAHISAHIESLSATSPHGLAEADYDRGELAEITAILARRTGHDFSQYKVNTMYRRIERRVGIHQLESIGAYAEYLLGNAPEQDLLFSELLIGVTSFFRDPEEWNRLRDEGIPSLLGVGRPDVPLRAWVAGCSTGEEAYSLAIVLREAFAERKQPGCPSVQLFATDLSADSIVRARRGTYPETIASEVSPERIAGYFSREGDGYRVSSQVRQMVVFAPHSVTKDPPFTKLDIVSCRNLLIYMEPAMQRTVLRLFHYALKPNGLLLLGSAESADGLSGLFAPLDVARSRIYRRRECDALAPPMALLGRSPSSAPHAPEIRKEVNPVASLQSAVENLLLQAFSPAAVVVNAQGDVLYINGRTGKYLEPAAGKANWNIFAMAREGLRYQLATAFAQVAEHKQRLVLRNVAVGTNGDSHLVDVTLQPMDAPQAPPGSIVVVFSEAAAMAPDAVAPGVDGRPCRTPRIAELEAECRHAREELQRVRADVQTSQEEHRAANEELQSLNEELQSANEELTTSREELQSLNEELQTLNGDLKAKVDELCSASNDMSNLLNSTDIATIFLDSTLRVRRFTPMTTRILRLLPGDVGRPVTDIVSELLYTEISDDATEVLRTLTPLERHVRTRDGRCCVVRTLPYRTLDNVIDGVVITVTDITTSKTLESEMSQLLDSFPQLLWTADREGLCDRVGRLWTEYTGASASGQLGYGWLQQVHPEDRDRASSEWRAAVSAGVSLGADMRIRRNDGEYRWFRVSSLAIRDPSGHTLKWYVVATDIDDSRRSAAALRESEEQLQAVLEGVRGAV